MPTAAASICVWHKAEVKAGSSASPSEVERATRVSAAIPQSALLKRVKVPTNVVGRSPPASIRLKRATKSKLQSGLTLRAL